MHQPDVNKKLSFCELLDAFIGEHLVDTVRITEEIISLALSSHKVAVVSFKNP